MGTLYRNGIPYVGSGGAGGVEVTQAEYDALPTSEKMNGSIYFITDGSVSYPTASQMRYDNTESGIPSNSVQGAIDELKIEIGDTDISSVGDGTLSGAVSELNAGLNTLVLLGSSGQNPNSEIVNLSDSIQNYKYLVFLVSNNASSNVLGTSIIPLSLVGLGNGNYVSNYTASNYRISMVFTRNTDTQFNIRVEERAGFNGYGKIYGAK